MRNAGGLPRSAPTRTLYFVLWIPGLIANLVFWQAARSDEQLSGRTPEGKGCLTTLLAVFVVLPVLATGGVFLLFTLMVLGAGLSGTS